MTGTPPRPDRAARRSGDPRRRARQVPVAARSATSARSARSARSAGSAGSRLLVAGLAGGVAVVVVTLLGLRGSSAEPDVTTRVPAGRDHAVSACDLMAKAHEAAEVDSGARYAATVLLLDQAIVESARAARTNPDFSPLDGSIQELHTAAHTGDRAVYQPAVEAAEEACRSTVG